MKLLLLIVASLFMGCTQTETINIVKLPPKAKISNMISKIPIHFKDNGYHNVQTTLITKQDELEEFLSDIEQQQGWDKKENFLNTLKREKINFQTHNILFHPITANAGSILFAVELPKSLDKHITVVIDKETAIKKEGKFHYGLAYMVKKSAKDITFNEGGERTTIPNRRSQKPDLQNQ